MFHRRWKTVIAILLAVGALAGCGGGGGGGGSGGSGGGGGGGPTPPPPPPTFTVGGSISGLVGSVTLQNTGGPQLTVSADGSFTFAGTVASGSSYDVTVATQPELQTCTVANGSGTANANVTNITISCTDATSPTLSLSLQAIKSFSFAWTAVPGSTRYRLLEDPTGNSDFTQVGADIDSSAASLDHIVPLHRRVNARYLVQACAATRCIDSNTVNVSGSLAEAVGYFKAANISANDELGFSVALSADGTTLAVGVLREDSNATGVGGNPDNEQSIDSGAVYVFVRDDAAPTWRQQAYIKALDAGQFDQFGVELALDSSGSTLAVGANQKAGDAGAVYVFERSNGVWTQQDFVRASDHALVDFFGSSLALSDSGHLAVGAPFKNGLFGTPDAGAVYVFVKEGAAWREDIKLQASNQGGSDRFGTSVALSRDGATLAVGAPREDSDATDVGGDEFDEDAQDAGAVYVFNHGGGQWLQRAYIKASNTGTGDRFGEALALSADGSTLAVGAPFERSAATGINGDESDDTLVAAGAAYVFVVTGNQWRQQAYVKASNTVGVNGTGAGDSFGTSLSLSADGSTLAVGAPGEDSSAIGINGEETDNSAGNAGAAYFFERSSDVWAQRAYLKPSNTSAGYLFGNSVALSGDGATLAAGARFETGSDSGIDGDQNSPPIVGAGAVYLY